jgi:hypothetical protein
MCILSSGAVTFDAAALHWGTIPPYVVRSEVSLCLTTRALSFTYALGEFKLKGGLSRKVV